MKLMPASRAARTMRSDSDSSARSPNIIAPRHSDDTSTPLRPSLRCVIAIATFRELRNSRRSKYGQVLERSSAPLAADRVELAVVLDRINERVEPLQLVDLAAANADAEVQRAQHDLHLVVLAGVVAVEPVVDEQAGSADVDLSRDQRLQLGRLVVEALELKAL